MWFYRCELCGARKDSYAMVYKCEKPKCKGLLRVESSQLHYELRPNDVNRSTGTVSDRTAVDLMTGQALDYAFSKIDELSKRSVLRVDFTAILRRKDHYGKTVTTEWEAHVIDDLMEQRDVRKVEYKAGVNIDTAHIPKVVNQRHEFRGPDKPHVGWELSTKVLAYRPDGTEKTLSQTTVVGHVILDDVPVFRPVVKGEHDPRNEVHPVEIIDKRKQARPLQG